MLIAKHYQRSNGIRRSHVGCNAVLYGVHALEGFALGFKPDCVISGGKQLCEVSGKYEPVNKAPEEPERGLKLKNVSHHRIGTRRLKVVVVLEQPEPTTNHRISKVPRAVECGNP